MSKAVKQLMIEDYKAKLGDIDDALVISLRGLDGVTNNEVRSALAKQEIRVTVIRNALFKNAFADTNLGSLADSLEGSSALAYGAESVVEVARAIVDLAKENEGIELKGAVLDGQLFAGDAGVRELSKFPTRDEAIAQDVTLILGPGRKLLGAVKGPGSNLAGIIKAIEDKLEKGETISAG